MSNHTHHPSTSQIIAIFWPLALVVALDVVAVALFFTGHASIGRDIALLSATVLFVIQRHRAPHP